MAETENQWIDKCTSIKQTDPKYSQVQKLVSQSGCLNENSNLTACLQKNRKDWRICKDQTVLLNQCIKKSKQSAQ